ncbi:Hypothetical Protein FCC1311_075082 [Hondaea fermentalgiana]|uniref:Serine protease n=1 Tax=Hondaea fermentalgiana TaxID=2315210 RepID=A0A2R5GKX2_9STRA|nr:Hypothetical Protein FCC1311_075082 [Hondaea fermentalgiana]|eukprot:GBG31285.1 Hypothetical Protein FCC1311_075082 [Hondaea fermentalgiana]
MAGPTCAGVCSVASLRIVGELTEDDTDLDEDVLGLDDEDGEDVYSEASSTSSRSVELTSSSSFSSSSSTRSIASKVVLTRDVIEHSNGTTEVVVHKHNVPLSSSQRSQTVDGRRRLEIYSNLATWSRISKRIWPYSAIGRIRIVENGLEYSCTGTLVAPNIVLTAGHCAINQDTGEVLEEIYFEPDLINGETFEEYSIVGMYGFMGEESFLYNSNRDWMFLFTRESVGTRYGWLSIRSSVPFDSNGELDVRVSGYAIHSQCNSGYSLCEGEGTMTRRDNGNEGSYKINTASGSSGGPITLWGDDGSVEIVGVHVKTVTLSRINVGILSSEIHSYLQEAKRRSYSSDAADQYKVRGIVCTAHDNCDDSAFCANINGGRCFRCDATGDVNSTVSTFDGSDYPLKCASSSGSGSNVDLDTDCDISINGASVEGDVSVCVSNNSLCIGETSCGASGSLSESSDPTVYVYLQGVYISTKYVDVFEVTQDEFDSFDQDANLLARARGYRGGALNDTLTVVAFGSVQAVTDDLDLIVSSISPSSVADPTEGVIFLTLTFVLGTILLMTYARWRIAQI